MAELRKGFNSCSRRYKDLGMSLKRWLPFNLYKSPKAYPDWRVLDCQRLAPIMMRFSTSGANEASLCFILLTLAALAVVSALPSIPEGLSPVLRSQKASVNPDRRRENRVVVDEQNDVPDGFSKCSEPDLKERNWVPRPSLTGAVEPPSEGPYSLSFYQNGLTQWIFGDTDRHCNISVSVCLGSDSVVGRYRFVDGHYENDVTKHRIYQDLRIGSGFASFEYYASRTLSNAQDTLIQAQALLSENIICGLRGNVAALDNFKRRLLAVQGTRLAWIGVAMNKSVLGTLGLALSSSDWDFGLKVGLGSLLLVMTTIIDLLIYTARDRGYLAGPEAAIGHIFLAVVNRLIYQTLQSGSVEGPCVPETQLTGAIERVGSFEDSDLSVATPGSGYSGMDCPAY